VDSILQNLGAAIVPKILSVDGQSAPFTDRWGTGFPTDKDIQEYQIVPGKPAMRLYASEQRYIRDWALVKTEKDIRITGIIHEGSSTLMYELTGEHRGNCSYILKIVEGGDPGVATYTLSNDGGESWSETYTIPGSGEVVIGDGTTMVFSGYGQFIADDAYSWQTVSLQINTYRTHRLTGQISIDMIAADSDEMENYHGQLISLLSKETGFNNGGSIINISIANTYTPIEDDRIMKYRVAVTIGIDGALYITKQIPLAGLITVEIEN